MFERIIILFFMLTPFFTVSCKSTREVVSDIGTTNTAYREIANDLREQQSELGITGQRIEDRSYQLEQSITAGTEPIQEIRGILQQIRGQPVVEDESANQKNTDNTATIKPAES